MGIVVTGIGPRSGTSAMMRSLIKMGYEPIGSKFPSYCVQDENPLGYWDLEMDELCSHDRLVVEKNQCIKVFPNKLHRVDVVDIDMLIVMYRVDRLQQVESIKRVLEKEQFALSDKEVWQLITDSASLVNDMSCKKLYIKMDDLKSFHECLNMAI